MAGTGTGGASGGSSAGGTSSGGTTSTGGPGLVAAGVRWVGRVDTTNMAQPSFGWTASGFVASFTGTSIGVTLSNSQAYFYQALIDGVVKPEYRFQSPVGTGTTTIATGLADGAHKLELYRETECYGPTQFMAITGGTLTTPPDGPGRLIEFVGDSIQNGYGELGTEFHPNSCSETMNGCGYTYDTQSGYLSYGAVTARQLGADWSIVAKSGWGAARDNQSGSNVMPGVYQYAYYQDGTKPEWTFPVKANATVINLGTNDVAPGPVGPEFQTAIENLITTIQTDNPGAWVFLVAGPMLSGDSLTLISNYMMGAVMTKGGDAGKVAFVDVGTQAACAPEGTGCQWHPSVAEHQRVADVLTPIIKSKLGW
jgi:hypothetical protein